MSHPRVRQTSTILEQGVATLAGGGANVDATITTIGLGKNEQSFASLQVTASVAGFIRFNGTPCPNAAGATAYPLAAGVGYKFDGPITSFSCTSTLAGTVAWVASA